MKPHALSLPSLLTLTVALLATVGCADPSGRFDEFGERKGRPDAIIDGLDPCAPASPEDLTGEFLMALGPTPLEQQIPIVFKLLSTAEPSADGGFTMHWSVRPLDYLDRKSEITIDGVLQEVDLGSLEVNATGGMTQQLPSLTITGKANPFTGRDITAAVKFTGSFCEAKPAPTRLEAPNFYCGTLAGNITSPLVLSLDGSFYTIERIVDGVIPSPVIVGCDGLEANPPKPL